MITQKQTKILCMCPVSVQYSLLLNIQFCVFKSNNCDLQSKHRDTKGGRWEWDGLGDWDWCMYNIDTMDKIDN